MKIFGNVTLSSLLVWIWRGQRLGIASAIKKSRSIMIKRLEMRVVESNTTARYFCVKKYILSTLTQVFPQIDWDLLGAYFLSRVAQHGKCCADELCASARTVCETCFEPQMAIPIVSKPDGVAQQAYAGTFKRLDAERSWQVDADRSIRQKWSCQ